MNPVLKNKQREEYLARINRVIDHIEHNLDQNLSLTSLARVANFSRFYFHRIFHAMVGEPLNQFIQRVRVEKTAIQLISNPQKSITEIALDYGYSSSASFARAFREHFNMSASQWRALNADCKSGPGADTERQPLFHFPKDRFTLSAQLNPLTNRYQWKIKMTGFKDIQVQVKEMPEFHVAYVRHIGPYATDEVLFRGLFERLLKWAKPRDLLIPGQTTLMSVYHDDPKITEQNKLRVSACLTVPPGTKTEKDVGSMVVPGGRFVIAQCEIRSNEYGKAWDALMGGWMPDSGYQPDDRLCYEIAHNNPDQHPEQMHLVDICVPVKPL